MKKIMVAVASVMVIVCILLLNVSISGENYINVFGKYFYYGNDAINVLMGVAVLLSILCVFRALISRNDHIVSFFIFASACLFFLSSVSFKLDFLFFHIIFSLLGIAFLGGGILAQFIFWLDEHKWTRIAIPAIILVGAFVYIGPVRHFQAEREASLERKEARQDYALALEEVRKGSWSFKSVSREAISLARKAGTLPPPGFHEAYVEGRQNRVALAREELEEILDDVRTEFDPYYIKWDLEDELEEAERIVGKFRLDPSLIDQALSERERKKAMKSFENYVCEMAEGALGFRDWALELANEHGFSKKRISEAMEKGIISLHISNLSSMRSGNISMEEKEASLEFARNHGLPLEEVEEAWRDGVRGLFEQHLNYMEPRNPGSLFHKVAALKLLEIFPWAGDHEEVKSKVSEIEQGYREKLDGMGFQELVVELGRLAESPHLVYAGMGLEYQKVATSLLSNTGAYYGNSSLSSDPWNNTGAYEGVYPHHEPYAGYIEGGGFQAWGYAGTGMGYAYAGSHLYHEGGTCHEISKGAHVVVGEDIMHSSSYSYGSFTVGDEQ